jgi:DNA polymerase III delta subunit
MPSVILARSAMCSSPTNSRCTACSSCWASLTSFFWPHTRARPRYSATYRATIDRAYGLPGTPQDDARDTLDQEATLGAADYLRGWLLGAQLRAALIKKFGAGWWQDPAAGAFLKPLLAPGNGLAIVEETESSAKVPPSKPLSEAIGEAGGLVRRIEAPRQEALAAWIELRARERSIRLAGGAARELATRVGGFVREGDVERQQQGWLAVMELEKLALRHAADEPVTVDDVQALVPEAVPGSMWAFVDAVGMRQRVRALELLERLIEDRPAPVLLAVLHRRLRELIEVQDRLERGESPGSLVRSMRLVPFRAETLARQARAWTGPELDAALEGLVELDALVKGVGGRASTDARDRLAFDLWITDRVAPA